MQLRKLLGLTLLLVLVMTGVPYAGAARAQFAVQSEGATAVESANAGIESRSEAQSSGGPAVSPWPTFKHDLQHTGVSPHRGPATRTVKWAYNTGAKVLGSPVIGPGNEVLVGNYAYWEGRPSRLVALDETGSLLWDFFTPQDLWTPAIASDGTIYIQSAVTPSGTLYAIENKTKKWEVSIPEDLADPIVTPDGLVLIGSWDGKLRAFNSNAQQQWEFQTGGRIHSVAAVGQNGTIYVGSGDGKLYALNPIDGAKEWEYDTGGYIADSAPSIDAAGTIYVGNQANKLTAVNADGSLKWQVTLNAWVVSTPSFGVDGTIYVGTGGHYWYGYSSGSIYALDASEGHEKWKYDSPNGFGSSPAVDVDGNIYAGSGDGNMYSFSPAGDVRWKLPLGGGPIFSSPAIGRDGTLYVGSADGYLYAIGESAPSESAQRGVNWLGRAAANWQNANNCFGCHVQPQAIRALSIGLSHGFDVDISSGSNLKKLIDGTLVQQNPDGGIYHVSGPSLNVCTQWGVVGMSSYDEMVESKTAWGYADEFLRMVDFLLDHREGDGHFAIGRYEAPVDQGDIMATANMIMGFRQAYNRTWDATYASAMNKAKEWLKAQATLVKNNPTAYTTQDKTHIILGLVAAGVLPSDQALQDTKNLLLSEQYQADGGWGEDVSIGGSNPFATGQVVYALKAMGEKVGESQPLEKGVRYLLNAQHPDGHWEYGAYTRSGRRSSFEATMWPVIALVGGFYNPAEATGFKVTGTVVDETNGSYLIPYALVTLRGTRHGAPTQRNGTFSIGNVPAGSYYLEVSAFGYANLTKPIEVTANTSVGVLELQPMTTHSLPEGFGLWQQINQIKLHGLPTDSYLVYTKAPNNWVGYADHARVLDPSSTDVDSVTVFGVSSTRSLTDPVNTATVLSYAQNAARFRSRSAFPILNGEDIESLSARELPSLTWRLPDSNVAKEFHREFLLPKELSWSGQKTVLGQWEKVGKTKPSRAGSSDGQMDSPGDVAVDRQGSIYEVDTGNDRIQKFRRDGALITSWGGKSLLDQPTRISVSGWETWDDSDDLVYVVDKKGIQVFDSRGVAKASETLFLRSRFAAPRDVAVDRWATLYVANGSNIEKLEQGSTNIGVVHRVPDYAITNIAVDHNGSIYYYAQPTFAAPDYSLPFARVIRHDGGGRRFGVMGEVVTDIAADREGNLYYYSNRTSAAVRRIDANAGELDYGRPVLMGVSPNGLFMPLLGNDLYVADTAARRILVGASDGSRTPEEIEHWYSWDDTDSAGDYWVPEYDGEAHAPGIAVEPYYRERLYRDVLLSLFLQNDDALTKVQLASHEPLLARDLALARLSIQNGSLDEKETRLKVLDAIATGNEVLLDVPAEIFADVMNKMGDVATASEVSAAFKLTGKAAKTVGVRLSYDKGVLKKQIEALYATLEGKRRAEVFEKAFKDDARFKQDPKLGVALRAAKDYIGYLSQAYESGAVQEEAIRYGEEESAREAVAFITEEIAKKGLEVALTKVAAAGGVKITAGPVVALLFVLWELKQVGDQDHQKTVEMLKRVTLAATLEKQLMEPKLSEARGSFPKDSSVADSTELGNLAILQEMSSYLSYYYYSQLASTGQARLPYGLRTLNLFDNAVTHNTNYWFREYLAKQIGPKRDSFTTWDPTSLASWDRNYLYLSQQEAEMVRHLAGLEGVIVVRGDSPVDLLVIDGQGRRVGYDPTTGGNTVDITGATYSGAGSEPQIIRIPLDEVDLNTGYRLMMYGTDDGTYTVTTTSDDPSVIIPDPVITGVVTRGEIIEESVQLQSLSDIEPPDLTDPMAALAVDERLPAHARFYINHQSPTISAYFGDSQSGLATDTARLVMDGTDVTSETSKLSQTQSYSLEYMPTQSLTEGPHSLLAAVQDNKSNETTETAELVVDLSSPAGSLAIESGRRAVNTTSVGLSVDGWDNYQIGKMRFRNEDATWSDWKDYWIYSSWAIPSSDGTKTVYAEFMDAAGNTSTAVSDTIFLETVPPTASLSAPRISTDVSQTKIFRLFWSGADSATGTGIAGYDVDYKTGARGAWRTWKSDTTAVSSSFVGASGHTYYFRANARDGAGNVGRSAIAKTIVPFDDRLRSIKRGFRGLARSSRSSSYLGTLTYSTKAKESIEYGVVGNSINLIVHKGPRNSMAKIFVDGRYRKTVDTYSSRHKYRQVVYTIKFRSLSRHRIKIVNLATRGRTRFDVDAIAVGT